MTEIFRNIAYASQSDTQMMDIYVPDVTKGTWPVIIWLHPGGFTMGDKEMIQPLVAGMLQRGFAAVSVNYRLAGEAGYPAQIFDSKAAVRWIRAAASKYNFNPNKIIAWGISAGSTLAALLGTTENIKELEDLSMGNPNVSSKVNAVVSWYGPMSFSTLSEQRIKLGQKPFQAEESSGEFLMMGEAFHHCLKNTGLSVRRHILARDVRRFTFNTVHQTMSSHICRVSNLPGHWDLLLGKAG